MPAVRERERHRPSALRHRPAPTRRGGARSSPNPGLAGARRSHFPQAARPHRLPQAGKMAAAAEGREKGAGRERERSAILLLLRFLPPAARPCALPPPSPLRARATGRCPPRRGSLPRVCPPAPPLRRPQRCFFVVAWCWVFLFSACRRGEGRWGGGKRGGSGGSPSGRGQSCLGRRRPATLPEGDPGMLIP